MIPHQQIEPGGANSNSRCSKTAKREAEAVKYKSYSKDSDPLLLAKVLLVSGERGIIPKCC